jgi:hypothetical protein
MIRSHTRDKGANFDRQTNRSTVTLSTVPASITSVRVEISGGDSAARVNRVLANVRIPKEEFDDVTSTYGL